MNIIIKDTTCLSFTYYRVYVNGVERCRLRGLTKSMTIDDVKSGDKVTISGMNNGFITNFELDNPDGTILISRKRASYYVENLAIVGVLLAAVFGDRSEERRVGKEC